MGKFKYKNKNISYETMTHAKQTSLKDFGFNTLKFLIIFLIIASTPMIVKADINFGVSGQIYYNNMTSFIIANAENLSDIQFIKNFEAGWFGDGLSKSIAVNTERQTLIKQGGETFNSLQHASIYDYGNDQFLHTTDNYGFTVLLYSANDMFFVVRENANYIDLFNASNGSFIERKTYVNIRNFEIYENELYIVNDDGFYVYDLYNDELLFNDTSISGRNTAFNYPYFVSVVSNNAFVFNVNTRELNTFYQFGIEISVIDLDDNYFYLSVGSSNNRYIQKRSLENLTVIGQSETSGTNFGRDYFVIGDFFTSKRKEALNISNMEFTSIDTSNYPISSASGHFFVTSEIEINNFLNVETPINKDFQSFNYSLNVNNNLDVVTIKVYANNILIYETNYTDLIFDIENEVFTNLSVGNYTLKSEIYYEGEHLSEYDDEVFLQVTSLPSITKPVEANRTAMTITITNEVETTGNLPVTNKGFRYRYDFQSTYTQINNTSSETLIFQEPFILVKSFIENADGETTSEEVLFEKETITEGLSFENTILDIRVSVMFILLLLTLSTIIIPKWSLLLGSGLSMITLIYTTLLYTSEVISGLVAFVIIGGLIITTLVLAVRSISE